MKKIIIYLLVLVSIGLYANDFVSGEILVLLHDDVKGDAYISFKSSYAEYDLMEIEVISARLNLFHFRFDHKKISEEDFLSIISKDALVDVAQLNHYYLLDETEIHDEIVEDEAGYPNQTNPEDDFFSIQWALNISIPLYMYPIPTVSKPTNNITISYII